MFELMIFLLVSAVLALLCAGLFALARWCELRSATGSWQFTVFCLRLLATLMGVLGLIWVFTYNILALLVVVMAVVALAMMQRRMTRESLVWVLALCTSRGLPLAPSLAAYALECRGGLRWRILRFAQRLAAGQSISESLRRDRGVLGPLLTRDGAAAVCVGMACGDLPGALEDAARHATARRPVMNEFLTRAFYISQVIVVTLLITTGVMYFIVPAFIKIFEDFDADLPRLTVLVISWFRFWFKYGASMVAIGILVAIPLATLLFLLWRFTPFNVPFLRGFVLNRHMPPLLRALAGVVERGQPLPVAMNAIAEGYPTRPIRRRMAAIRDELAAGAVGWRPFARHGLLSRAEADVLDAATRVGNLPWAMRALADGRERRQGYRTQVAMQIFWPLTILVVGSFVALFVVAMMLPIIGLIEKLA